MVEKIIKISIFYCFFADVVLEFKTNIRRLGEMTVQLPGLFVTMFRQNSEKTSLSMCFLHILGLLALSDGCFHDKKVLLVEK